MPNIPIKSQGRILCPLVEIEANMVLGNPGRHKTIRSNKRFVSTRCSGVWSIVAGSDHPGIKTAP